MKREPYHIDTLVLDHGEFRYCVGKSEGVVDIEALEIIHEGGTEGVTVIEMNGTKVWYPNRRVHCLIFRDASRPDPYEEETDANG